MKNKDVSKRERKNLAQEAYNEIRDRIFSNDIKAGELIKESEIAQELGISRTPVREAIRMLESEDILEVRDGVGTYVKVLSFKDIKDIFEVRKALEVIAIKTAIYRIPESEITELENELKKAIEKYKSGVLKERDFVDTDIKLHKLIIDYSDNEYIKSIFSGIDLKIKQFQFISYENLNNSKESILQHLKILELIKNKSLDEIIVYLEEHIDWSLRGLLL